MSATSTPQRQSRGVVVPGIDTAASFDKHSTAIQCGGWLTPPQSAHESRRPSYSDLPHSAAPTATSFSVPPTPVHSAPHHTYYPHTQVLGDGLAHDVFPGPGTSLLSRGFDRLLQPVLEKTSTCMPDQAMGWSMPTMPHSTPGRYSVHPTVDSVSGQWSDQDPLGQGFISPASGLQSTLYSNGNNMLSQSHVLSSSYTGSACSLAANASSLSSFGYESGPEAYYQPQELVDLSQVSPQDAFGASQCSHFDSSDHSMQSTATSFSSAGEYIDHFEAVQPRSPVADYCMEEDDFVVVKNESNLSPSLYGGIGRAHGLPNPGHLRSRDSRGRVTKQRKRPARSQEGDWFGINVRVEGDLIGTDGDGRVVPYSTRKSHKSHKCKYILDDGKVCNEGFERSEHLKRHMGKHASREERAFHCPLETPQKKCDKAIGRSDNACDHFKTHMKLTEKNRRNDWFHWDVVSREICRAYSEKASTKIQANLIRWLLQPENKALQIAHGLVHGVADDDSS